MAPQQMICHDPSILTLKVLTAQMTIKRLIIQTESKYIHRKLLNRLPVAPFTMQLYIADPAHTVNTDICDSLQRRCYLLQLQLQYISSTFRLLLPFVRFLNLRFK